MTIASPTTNGAAPSRPPWVLVSAGFHGRGGQSRANAALAEYLLRRGHPVHLVAHDLEEGFLDRPGCTVHPVHRPLRRGLPGLSAIEAVRPGGGAAGVCNRPGDTRAGQRRLLLLE